VATPENVENQLLLRQNTKCERTTEDKGETNAFCTVIIKQNKKCFCWSYFRSGDNSAITLLEGKIDGQEA